uniref:F-box domain-containing protein n=1 Tax=Leucosporidium scottii TaxID=5278 RepID=A0A0H5FUX0_9BASI|nr:hypothetical protein [Leucosporidium scottii]
MAAIQDLPLELLRRILELLDTDWPPQRNLYNTSLVARAWRHPSQSLLLYRMDLQYVDLTLCTVALRLNAGCTLRLVDVDSRNAREILTALQEHDISVETLEVYEAPDSDLDLSTLSLKLLAGVFSTLRRRRLSLTAPQTPGLKSLWIAGYVKGHPIIPPDTKLKLTKLTVYPHFQPSLAFFDSILPAAPFLTSLELVVREDGELLPPEYTLSFRAIAHQLRHLAITSHASSRASLNVTRFVAACISLRSLELCNCGTTYIGDVASAVRAPLCVLETQMASGWNDGGSGIAELASVLELPAMATLKRWRLSNYTVGGPLMNQEERGRWEAACRARGVEPRDQTLFFTGNVVSPFL